MMSEVKQNFAELEHRLATIHAIDPARRSAFQSRLKNFHRLKFPRGFKAVKGKTFYYRPLEIVEIALAVEMTQLGLPPERTTLVLDQNRWSVLMAIELVARELRSDPSVWTSKAGLSENALAMFIYFDPSALHSLTSVPTVQEDTERDQQPAPLFNVGVGVVSEDIARWTSRTSARLSIINVTHTVASVAQSQLAEGSAEDLAYRREFFTLLEENAAKERAEP